MTVKFKKGETKTSRGLYPYLVFIDGEHRATFKPEYLRKGYSLADIDGGGIVFTDYEPKHIGHRVSDKSYFAETIDRGLERGLIPTAADMVAKRLAHAAAIQAVIAETITRRRMAALEGEAAYMLAWASPDVAAHVKKAMDAAEEAVRAMPDLQSRAASSVANQRATL